MNPHSGSQVLACDLHGLHLFRLVADSGGFTRAGERAGLTQSAVSRQIGALETELNVLLFERTTRQVRLTEAGRFLYEKASGVIDGLGHSIEELRRRFADGPKVLRVGISTTIGMAYLPGFFNAYRKRLPSVHTEVASSNSSAVIDGVREGQLDVGLVGTTSGRLPSTLEVTHRFKDDFCLIVPPDCARVPSGKEQKLPILSSADLAGLAASERWILIAAGTQTGKELGKWLHSRDINVVPVIESQSFDLIVNLVSLGMGISLVPNRALPLYLRQRSVIKLPCRPRFFREIAVVTRKTRTLPEHVRQFVDEILY